MNTAPMPAPSPAPAQVRPCRFVHLHPLPSLPKRLMSCAPLFQGIPSETLLAEFRAAPQFSQIPLSALLEHHRGSLRVLLLGESPYYACQAALYLTALFRSQDGFSPQWEEDSFWELLNCDLESEEDSSPPVQLERSLAVISPQLLDPSLGSFPEKRPLSPPREESSPKIDLSRLDAPAALLSAPAGPVLTPQVLEQIDRLSLRDGQHPLDLFLALNPRQMDLELLEELRFTYGFQVCRVGQPGPDYLCRLLRSCAEDLLCPIDPQADLERVVAHTRRLRGAAFQETDLEGLVAWAVQRRVQPPLTTRDLLFSPFRSQRQGWKRLEGMTGLQPVKDALRRLLARAALEGRRRQSGQGRETPFCRNLAFSGPPGTGKSVTARLAAQILREEGCGTGRFVEAGREQLIGPYLGNTSPMVAQLFERARGGVLFLDEAGALLDSGQDIYAVEAVNALVRHMELEPETMVIFATYPGEMGRLLASNPGLSSRIAQVLEFPAYDNGQLWEIFQSFARTEGYALPEGAEELCEDFFSRLRRANPEGFGNGREARRLFQGAVEELALRALSDPGTGLALSLRDLGAAADRLLVRPGGAGRRTIGF